MEKRPIFELKSRRNGIVYGWHDCCYNMHNRINRIIYTVMHMQGVCEGLTCG